MIMQNQSKAYTKFERTINRSIALINAYTTYRGQISVNTQRRAPKDLIRASVVFAVAALDAYITDVFSEKLVPYIKKFNPDDSLIEILSKSGLDTKEALILIKMDRPYRRIRNLVERYYQTYTTQRFEVIDKLFLAYSLKDISNRAQEKSGRKTLKRSVEILVGRRHNIVHDGDYNSHNRLVFISPKEIERRINNLKLFVKCLEEIISNKI